MMVELTEGQKEKVCELEKLFRNKPKIRESSKNIVVSFVANSRIGNLNNTEFVHSYYLDPSGIVINRKCICRKVRSKKVNLCSL